MELEDQINQVVYNLNKGKINIIPTETVYGIIADATNNLAVERIYKAKSRDYSKPLQIFFPDIEKAQNYGIFGENALSVLKKYCPGPLTIIVKLKRDTDLASSFNINDDTVGIRVPDSKIVKEISNNFNKPIAATSANLSGEVSIPDSIENINDSVKECCDYILDQGKILNSQASTVVDFTDDNNPIILREGIIKF